MGKHLDINMEDNKTYDNVTCSSDNETNGMEMPGSSTSNVSNDCFVDWTRHWENGDYKIHAYLHNSAHRFPDNISSPKGDGTIDNFTDLMWDFLLG